MKNNQRQHGNAMVVYLLAAVCVFAMVLMILHQSGRIKAERVLREAAEAVVKTERGLRADAQETAARLDDKLIAQRRITNATRKKLDAALAATPDCSLSADAGRVLRDVAREGANAAPSTGAGKAAPQADPSGGGGAGDGATAQDEGGGPVSCRAIAIWGQRNIDEVLKPNAAQLEALQELYEKTRARLDK